MTSVLPLGTPIRQRYGRHRAMLSAPLKPESAPDRIFVQAVIESTFVEDWTRDASRVFLGWLAAPSGGRWLDARCGLGTLTQTILEHTAPIEVVGVDLSALHVAAAEAGITDFRARFHVADPEQLRFSADRFDTVVSAFSVCPESSCKVVVHPDLAIAEQVRVVRSKGVVGAYVWDFDDGIQIMRAFWDAATALDPAARIADPSQKSTAYRPGRLARLFKRGRSARRGSAWPFGANSVSQCE